MDPNKNLHGISEKIKQNLRVWHGFCYMQGNLERLLEWGELSHRGSEAGVPSMCGTQRLAWLSPWRRWQSSWVGGGCAWEGGMNLAFALSEVEGKCTGPADPVAALMR